MHDAVLDPQFPTDHYIRRYTQRHATMWEATATSEHEKPILDGYPIKVDRTIGDIQDLKIRADSDTISLGETMTIGDLFKENISLVVNGTQVGTLTDAVALMKEKIVAAAAQNQSPSPMGTKGWATVCCA